MTGAASAIDRRAIAVTHTREAPGGYDQTPGSPTFGEWVPGAETSTTIQAVVQPMSGRKLMDVPEGKREEAMWAAWSRAELRNDDRITYGGRTYVVRFVWPRAEDDFYRAAMGLTE